MDDGPRMSGQAMFATWTPDCADRPEGVRRTNVEAMPRPIRPRPSKSGPALDLAIGGDLDATIIAAVVAETVPDSSSTRR